MIHKYFLSFYGLGLSFHFTLGVFLSTTVSNFDAIQFFCFFFFCFLFFWYLTYVFFKSFIVLGFTFKSVIHFGLILEYGLYTLFAGPSNVFKIVKMIMERNFQPVIIFSFSKKDCEAYALQMTKLDFNTGTISTVSMLCKNECTWIYFFKTLPVEYY